MKSGMRAAWIDTFDQSISPLSYFVFTVPPTIIDSVTHGILVRCYHTAWICISFHTRIFFARLSDIRERVEQPRDLFTLCLYIVLHPNVRLPPHQSRISATTPQRSRTAVLLPVTSLLPHTVIGDRVHAHITPRMHARGAAAPRGARAHEGQGP